MSVVRFLFRDRSLWYKLSLLAVTPTIVAMLMLVGHFVDTVANAIMQGAMARNENLARLSALSVSNAMAVYHKGLLDNLVDGLARQSDVRFAAVVDASDGRVLAHSDHTRDGQMFDKREGGRVEAKNAAKGNARAPALQVHAAPVIIEAKRYADVIVAFSLDQVHDQVQLTRLRIYGATALAALIGLTLAVLLASRISRPILALADQAKALGRGHFETDLVYESQDAIGQLASAFNTMAGDIRRRQEALETEIQVRRRAEELWRRYEFIVNASKDWNTLINRDYIYEAANDAYCGSLNLARDQIIGHGVAAIWGQTVFEQDIRPRLDRCFTGQEVNYQVWLDTPRLPGHCYDVTLYPYAGISGQVTHAVVVSHDITVQKRAEQALEKRAWEMTTLHSVGRRVNASLVLDAVVEALLDSLGVSMEADFVALWLVENDRLVIKGQRTLRAPQPGRWDTGATEELSHRVWQQGKTIFSDHGRCETMVAQHGPNGGSESLAAIPLTSADRVWGVLCIGYLGQQGCEAQAGFWETLASEVSIGLHNALLHEQIQRHAAELEVRVAERTARLEAAMEKAREADRLKSAFLAAMSHELRTPLNSIIGFTGILRQGLVGPLNDEQAKQLGMVNHSAQHLLSLINDVLDISKIEAGQLQLTCAAFDMSQVVDKLVQTTRPLADKKALAIACRLAPDTGVVYADRRRVEQVLLNLLSNAIKFAESGTITIECRRTGEGLETRVTDTGIGIRREDFGKLFQAFHQLESGLTRRYEGTGLGLSICKKLVEMMGGRIWVQSQWGQGSTFAFTLPSGLPAEANPTGADQGAKT